MRIRIIFYFYIILNCSIAIGQTYDFYKRCKDRDSNNKAIEQTKINHCTRSVYCDPYSMYLLWDCGAGKGLYQSLKEKKDVLSHVNSIKFFKDEALISIVDFDVKSKKVRGRILKGRLEGETSIVTQTENGLFKFNEEKMNAQYEKYLQVKCSKDTIRFSFMDACFKKEK